MILNINNVIHEVNVDADTTLLSVLRDDLDLTGTKHGCGEGACGACTVHIDGMAVRSCSIKANSLLGKSITTIEGLGSKDKLHPVQQAFLKVDPLQCSYCATGMIMSAAAFLKQNPHPTTVEINQAMNGNICRCGTYPNIVKAIKTASIISSTK